MGDGQATTESIRTATENTLATADELGCSSLVIPAIGCGVAGFDLEAGARLICETIADYEPTSLEAVRFIGYDEREYDTIRAVASGFDAFIE